MVMETRYRSLGHCDGLHYSIFGPTSDREVLALNKTPSQLVYVLAMVMRYQLFY